MSWLNVDPESHFSLSNIPFGIVSYKVSTAPVAATRLGDYVVDLSVLEDRNLLSQAFGSCDTSYLAQPTLNSFAALSTQVRKAVRIAIQTLLSDTSSALCVDAILRQEAVHRLQDVTMHLPFQIPDFIDYSIFPAHALGAGKAIFGPDTPMPPAYNTLPMAYNGRAGSVSLDNKIVRPQGQLKRLSATRDYLIGPSEALDWEFEIGAFISSPTAAGTFLSPSRAQDHIFGFVLLNDWSARDLQAFEMVPLGPFNGKSFATTVSPWVIVPDALSAFTAPVAPRIEGMDFDEPEYLKEDKATPGNYQITCETFMNLATPRSAPQFVSRANFADAFWSFAQLVAYQTYSGAPIHTGDLLGSGTISSSGVRASGCLLEMTKGGKESLMIGNEERRWLQDGDEVIFTACAGEGEAKVGFGELRGTILAASALRSA